MSPPDPHLPPPHEAPDAANELTSVRAVAMAVTHDHGHAAGRSRLARNVLLVLTSQVLIWVAGAGVGILLPRFVTDKDVGRFTFAASFTAIFGLIVFFGSERYLTREVARAPDQAKHLAFSALLTRIPLFLFSAAVMAAFLFTFDYSPITIRIVGVLTINMFISGISGTLNAVFQGHERMGPAALAAIFERVLSGILGLAVIVLADRGMVAYAGVLVAGNLVSLSIIGFVFMRTIGLSWRVDIPQCRRILEGSAPFFVWGLALFVYGSIDITILSMMTNDSVVGWYGAAYRFLGIAAFFPFALTTALLPNISNMTFAQYQPLARRCLDIVTFIAVPIAVFFIVGAQSIIDFLGYPPEFDHSAVLLRILAIQVPAVGMTMIAGTLLIASDREGPRTRAALAAAVLSPCLNLVLIPVFQSRYDNGAIGSAIATCLVEGFIFVMMLRLLEPNTFGFSNIRTASRCAVAAVPMAGVMLAALPYGMPVVALAGGATYLVAALAVRAVSLDELLRLPALAMRSRRPQTEPVDGMALNPGSP